MISIIIAFVVFTNILAVIVIMVIGIAITVSRVQRCVEW